MSLPSIDQSMEIKASIERVWTVLTDEGLVAEWLGCMRFQCEIGAVFYMQPNPQRRASGDIEGATHCELVDLEPPTRMRFSWYMPGTPKTMVDITLSPQGGLTVVRLVHSGWDQFDADQVRGIRDMLAGGWKSHVLPGLKKVAEAA